MIWEKLNKRPTLLDLSAPLEKAPSPSSSPNFNPDANLVFTVFDLVPLYIATWLTPLLIIVEIPGNL